MSAVFWAQSGPRSVFTFDDVDYPVGGAWVLDIVTSSGNTQMFFSTQYPSPGVEQYNDPPVYSYDALTETDSDNTAAALQTAVNALDNVTSSTLTAFSIASQTGSSVLFDSSEWSNFEFDISLPTQDDTDIDYAQLTTKSPLDSVLSSDDIGTITSAMIDYIETLETVTGCAVVDSTITPDTI